MHFIFLSPAFREGSIERTAAAQLGDFIGGYVGTVFALVSILLLLATLRAQREATALESFETRFFQLITLHRKNADEMFLQNATGRRIFVLLVREFREIHRIVSTLATDGSETFSQKELLGISYLCLHYGTGPNSSRMLLQALGDQAGPLAGALVKKLADAGLKEEVQKRRSLGYVPFEGHQSRLAHYFRHLFQTVKYVDMRGPDPDRYDYVKTIRAQLTNHEQAILLLNSLSPLGREWWASQLLTRYRLVCNLPRDFFDSKTEMNVSELFSAGYFEWDESARV
ncbi:MAG: putative phage abortive infection protein [Thermoanaerobaculia bacterium]